MILTVPRTAQIAAVIFDMDGVIVDTEPIVKGCIQRAAGEFGLEIDDALYAGLVGRGTADCAAAFFTRFGLSCRFGEIQQRWTAYIRSTLEANGVETKPGVQELLDLLSHSGTRTAVATSTDFEDAMLCLRGAGLSEQFQVVVTGDQVEKGKPEPDIYREAATRLAVLPEYCLAIEDSDAGVIAASRAGIRTFMVPDGRVPSDQARAAAFHVMPSLHEVRAVISQMLT